MVDQELGIVPLLRLLSFSQTVSTFKCHEPYSKTFTTKAKRTNFLVFSFFLSFFNSFKNYNLVITEWPKKYKNIWQNEQSNDINIYGLLSSEEKTFLNEPMEIILAITVNFGWADEFTVVVFLAAV